MRILHAPTKKTISGGIYFLFISIGSVDLLERFDLLQMLWSLL
jgi:hypothetical protein